jgi:hypothetical protein
MNIHSAVVPAITMGSEELFWQGNKTRSGLIPIEYDPWLVTFTIDSLLYNWKLIFNWMSYINNNNDKISEYHNNYSVDCSLVVTNNYGYSILEIIFVSVWPSTLGEVSFSQREGDILLDSTVSFVYDYFYVKDSTWPIEFSSSSKSSSSKSISSSSESSSSSSSSSRSSSSSSSISSSSLSSSSLSSSSSESVAGNAIRWSEFDKGDQIQVVDFGRTAKNLADDSWRTIIANYSTGTSGKYYFEVTNYSDDNNALNVVGWQIINLNLVNLIMV